MAKKLNKMNRNNKLHTGKGPEGFVLVMTLFAALILPVLIIAYINIQTTDLTLIKNRMQSTKAYYIAEAGIADAINEMRVSGPLADTQWQMAFPTGSLDTYSVSVSQDSTVITSIGHAVASNFTRALEVTVAFPNDQTPFPNVVAIQRWKEVSPP